MSKPQNVMLVSIALIAATVCTAHACTKRLDETQWPETRDETSGPRPRHIAPRWDQRCIGPRLRRDWDVEDFVQDVIETRREYVSRPRRLDWDHISARR